jgi:hypothetical protein
MMQYIELDDIQAGDIIKVTESREGVLIERTGTVESVNTLRGRVNTKEGGVLWHLLWEGKPTFQLIDRPKPPLPIITGAVIIGKRIKGLGTPHIHLALRYDGYWVSLATGKVINASDIIEWTAAKVVEA